MSRQVKAGGKALKAEAATVHADQGQQVCTNYSCATSMPTA
jgi:hypothetical protein